MTREEIEKIKEIIKPYKIYEFEYEKIFRLLDFSKMNLNKESLEFIRDFFYNKKYDFKINVILNLCSDKKLTEKQIMFLLKNVYDNDNYYYAYIDIFSNLFLQFSMDTDSKEIKFISELMNDKKYSSNFIIFIMKSLQTGITLDFLRKNLDSINLKFLENKLKNYMNNNVLQEDFKKFLITNNFKGSVSEDFISAFYIYKHNLPFSFIKIKNLHKIILAEKIYKKNKNMFDALKFFNFKFFNNTMLLESVFKNTLNQNLKKEDFIFLFDKWEKNENKDENFIEHLIKGTILLLIEKIPKKEIKNIIDIATDPEELSISVQLTLIEKYKKQIKEILKIKEENKITELFTNRQLREIIKGIKHNLNEHEINFYANIEFNDKQMKEIRLGFEHGLSIEQIKIYAKPEFDYNVMNQIREALLKNIPEQIINFIIENGFDSIQIENIINGIENQLSLNEIKIYADPYFEGYDMEEFSVFLIYFKNILKIYLDMDNQEAEKYNIKYFNYFWNNNWSNDEIENKLENILKKIREYRKENIPVWIIKLILNPKLDYAVEKMIIKTYKEYNLTEKQMKLLWLTNFKINPETIKNIELKINKKGIRILICKGKIDDTELNILKNKLNINKVVNQNKKEEEHKLFYNREIKTKEI
jgi:hypothetical protein